MTSLTTGPFDESDTNLSSTRINNRRNSNISPTLELPFERRDSLVRSGTSITNSKDDRTLLKSSKIREVFRFQADWLVSSIAWSNVINESFHLAISSYIENYSNHIQLISLAKDSYDEELRSVSIFEHPYPATKLLWIPNPQNIQAQLPRLLATTADYLRIWRVEETPSSYTSQEINLNKNTSDRLSDQVKSSSYMPKEQVKLECLLNTNKGLKQCAPLTSFDWNEIDPSLIVTSSVDASCTVWNIEVARPINISQSRSLIKESIPYNLKTQVLAHENEVYDVSFSRAGTGKEIFISASGDGTLRLTDLRRPNSITLLYNTDNIPATSSDKKSLVRVSCNKQDPNYVSTFTTNSNEVLLLDLRSPSKPIANLNSHTANLNSMSWAPHSAHHICTSSDDCQALIWELSKLPNPVEEPLLAYRANGKINAISWSVSHSNWIAIGFENYLELLRV